MTLLTAAKVHGFDLDMLQKIADRAGPTVAEVATPVVANALPEVSFSHTIGETISRQKAMAACQNKS